MTRYPPINPARLVPTLLLWETSTDEDAEGEWGIIEESSVHRRSERVEALPERTHPAVNRRLSCLRATLSFSNWRF